jgi:peptidyl-prolyl cis-trans isomerase B (cyclophilin B)
MYHRGMQVLKLCAVSFCLGGAAEAQIVPERTYYGVNRPIPMRVQWDGSLGEDARIELFAPGSDVPSARAAVAQGAVNLASLFPTLWTDPAPRLLYAQLTVGETRVGAPVVLRPMLSPRRAMLWSIEDARPYYIDPATNQASIDPKRGEIVYTQDPPAYTGICAYVDRLVEWTTSEGVIVFRMRPDEAPNTVWNYLHLVEGGFYTDIVFHRIVPRTPNGHPFVIQVGDPSGTGDGGPGYAIDLEQSRLPHDFGVLSMARDADPNTNGSQVFVCLSREGTARLDGKYTAFGEAISGAEVILKIAESPVKGDRPLNPPVLISARLIDAPPFGQGASPVRREAAGSGHTGSGR